MAIQRSTIIRGPAAVTYGGATFFTKGDINVTIEHSTFDIETSSFGKVDTRVSGRKATITFTPDGVLNAAQAAILWPYSATAYGASILADAELVITPTTPTGGGTSSNKWTFYNAAITGMPDLILSATKTLVGQVTLTAIGKDTTAPSVAASLVLITASSAAVDAEYTNANVVTEPYTAAWGSTITGIETRDGFTCSFNAATEDVMTDSEGVRDLLLVGLEARISCQPINISEANLVTALAIDQAVGTSMLS